MANSGDERFLAILEQLSNDEEPMIAEHARWGVQRLSTSLGKPYRKHSGG